jgi:hypothetical protein
MTCLVGLEVNTRTCKAVKVIVIPKITILRGLLWCAIRLSMNKFQWTSITSAGWTKFVISVGINPQKWKYDLYNTDSFDYCHLELTAFQATRVVPSIHTEITFCWFIHRCPFWKCKLNHSIQEAAWSSTREVLVKHIRTYDKFGYYPGGIRLNLIQQITETSSTETAMCMAIEIGFDDEMEGIDD